MKGISSLLSPQNDIRNGCAVCNFLVVNTAEMSFHMEPKSTNKLETHEMQKTAYVLREAHDPPRTNTSHTIKPNRW